MNAVELRAPFPYAGGKRGAAELVWRAIGRVQNFIDPFFGSGAVLLSRPRECWATDSAPGTETVNDRSRFLANFWRALRADPDAVALHASWPVNETDLHARHRWLVARLPELAAVLDGDPDAFDAKIAGWWCHGACCWIGSGWCDEQRGPGAPPEQLPHMGNAGRGLHRKLPHTGDAGRGLAIQLPHLGGGYANHGQGINRLGVLEHGSDRDAAILGYLRTLSARLRDVRVACGDWTRVTGDSVTWRHGLTGVFLDPPYCEGAWEYAAGDVNPADVRAWAREAGERRDMRVVLAGYEGQHEELEAAGWSCVPWTARGGYGSQRRDGGNENRKRERLWCSPHCLAVADSGLPLFAARTATEAAR